MSKKLLTVKNIYFDTNVLVQLPLTASSPDFLNLKDSCDVFDTKLLMPEIALKKYINHNKREVFSAISNINDSIKTISKNRGRVKKGHTVLECPKVTRP